MYIHTVLVSEIRPIPVNSDFKSDQVNKTLIARRKVLAHALGQDVEQQRRQAHGNDHNHSNR